MLVNLFIVISCAADVESFSCKLDMGTCITLVLTYIDYNVLLL